MNYLGDFPTGATVYVPFHTFDSNGASVTLTGLATTDIEIYKNGVATTRASESGYTLLATDGIDFDGKTGIHGFSIDLSDDTDAGFYAAGNEYMIVVASVTVDSQTVNFVAATFSIERSGGALALLKNATYGLSAIETLVDDLESRLTAARAGYLDNINNAALSTTVAQTGDAFARLGAPAGASVSADVLQIKNYVDDIGVAGAGLTALGDTRLANLDAAVSTRSTYAGADTAGTTTLLSRVVGTLASGTHNPQSGDAFARLGAPAGASVSADIADLPTVTEFNARTLVAADYTVVSDLPSVPSAADIKTAMEADGSKLDHLWEMTEDDVGVRRLTTNALEQAPTGAGTSDLDELLASHDTEDTLGNVINDLVEEIGGLYRLTAGALAMAPGGGATTYSYSNTVDDGSGNLLDGVFVELATDSGMTNIVYTTHTNALGAFTVYSDIAGTHYLRLQLAGYSFTIQTVTLA